MITIKLRNNRNSSYPLLSEQSSHCILLFSRNTVRGTSHILIYGHIVEYYYLVTSLSSVLSLSYVKYMQVVTMYNVGLTISVLFIPSS